MSNINMDALTEFRVGPSTVGAELIYRILNRSVKGRYPEQFNLARTGIDFCTGWGDSALAIAQLCPNLSKLHTVEENLGVRIEESVQQKIGPILIEHKDTTVKQFLSMARQNDLVADIGIFSSAPTHGLTSKEDYESLASIIVNGGTIIEFHNLDLNETLMKLFFKQLDVSEGMRDSIRVWQKN